MERLDDSVQVDVLVRNWIERYSGPEICLADLLCDRHARTGRIALRYEDSAGREDSFRFAELQDLSARFAGVLQNAGISKGGRVATLLPKIPELVISALALWRLGAVHVPLFTAFGPGAVSFRLENSGARVLITNAANRPKIEPRAGLHVVTVELPDPADVPLGDTRFWQSLESSHRVPVPVSVSGDDLFILIYT